MVTRIDASYRPTTPTIIKTILVCAKLNSEPELAVALMCFLPGDRAFVVGGEGLSDVTGTPSYGPGGIGGAISPHAARARMAYAVPEWVMNCRLSLRIDRVNQRPLAR